MKSIQSFLVLYSCVLRRDVKNYCNDKPHYVNKTNKVVRKEKQKAISMTYSQFDVDYLGWCTTKQLRHIVYQSSRYTNHATNNNSNYDTYGLAPCIKDQDH